jgi:hypothetical protein
MNIFSSISGKVLLSVAAAGVVIAPLAAMAKDNNKGSNGESENRSVSVTVSAKPQVDVSIGSQGRVVVHGATVTGVSSSTVTATTNWGGTTITWSVNTSNAQITYKGGRDAQAGVIAAGDAINFEGTFAPTGSFAVNAKTVRDLSKEKAVMEKHTFSGTVTSAPASTTPTSFGFTSGGSTYTVKVQSGISVLGKNWLALPIGSFVVGDAVNVYGAVQASSTNTIDASVVRNTTR